MSSAMSTKPLVKDVSYYPPEVQLLTVIGWCLAGGIESRFFPALAGRKHVTIEFRLNPGYQSLSRKHLGDFLSQLTKDL